VTAIKPALVAVDGIAGPAITAAARAALTSIDRAIRSGVSHWDASGVFEELARADDAAGRPSARTACDADRAVRPINNPPTNAPGLKARSWAGY